MFPRCTILPLPDQQVSLQVEGRECLRWHFGDNYPRPFFYPLVGPASGRSLTRMGHPGDPGHDHHRSIWFGHARVNGSNFWTDATTARIRQKQWLAYADGDDAAVLAVRLGWSDGQPPRELLEQELIAAVLPLPHGEVLVELQSTFRAVAGPVELGQTNFGFLAVRMAKALSAFFGTGTLTNSAGAKGEAAVFGKPAEWMDYSGVQEGGHAEGITYFDHPSNPGHPTVWHVRDDGWMGASFSFRGGRRLTPEEPLTLRYLLHAHRGLVDPQRAKPVFEAFARRAAFEVVRSPGKHVAFGVRRRG